VDITNVGVGEFKCQYQLFNPQMTVVMMKDLYGKAGKQCRREALDRLSERFHQWNSFTNVWSKWTSSWRVEQHMVLLCI
jgi:hypothetical protein